MTFSPNFHIHIFTAALLKPSITGFGQGAKGPGVGLFSKVLFNLDKRRTKEKRLVQTSKENLFQK
jgi:hypothetical protein